MVNTGDVSQKTCNISNLVYKYARPELCLTSGALVAVMGSSCGT